MELVTGRTGSPHVTSQQFRGILESIFGTQSYLANVYEKFSYLIAPGNIIQVKSGILIHHGGIFLVPNGSIDEIPYKNGTQGMKRIDLIVARYSKDADQNTESAEWIVIQGEETTGEPAVPAHTSGNMQNGDLVDDCPVYAIHYDGLNIESVELLVPAVNLGGGGSTPSFHFNVPTGYGNWSNTNGGYWKHGNEVHVCMTFSKKSGTISNGINTPTSGQTGSSYKEKAFTGFPKPISPSTVSGAHITSSSSVTMLMASITEDGTLYIGVPNATSSNSSYSNYLNFSYLAKE